MDFCSLLLLSACQPAVLVATLVASSVVLPEGALTLLSQASHNSLVSSPLSPPHHNPHLLSSFCLSQLSQSGCYVVACRLGHHWGLRSCGPQVSEERRPELFDGSVSFVANLQHQFCPGKEQGETAGEQQIAPSGQVRGSRECSGAAPALPSVPRNLPGASVEGG